MQIKIQRIVGRGEAKDVICNTVMKLKADTLVMGSHGYGFFQRCVYMNILMIHFSLYFLGSYC